MDVHLPSIGELAELLDHYPVLLVLLSGLAFGSGVTQLVKKSYRDWFGHQLIKPISEGRFRFTVRILSAASTFGFALALWHICLGHNDGDELISGGTAVFSPALYDWIRAFIRWKWPGLVRSWQDNEYTQGDFDE